MSVPSRVSDALAAMPLGTTAVTTSLPATYVVNNEKLEYDLKETAEEYTGSGGPGRWAGTKQRWKYEGEWQVPDAAATYPNGGQTFTRTCPNDGTKTFIITKVPPYDATADPGVIRVIKIAAIEQIYGVIITT